MNLILASASPRRKEILSMLDIPFEIIPADIDENVLANESPIDYVHRLSIEKAKKVADIHPKATVIGSDLTVDFRNDSYAKAENADEAKSMLKKFSGNTHYTRCGFAVIHRGILISSGIASTKITFRKIPEDELNVYVDTEEWRGKAGAYGVQGAAAKFVQDFNGSYFDILGLPIYEIGVVLIKLGYKSSNSVFEEIQIKDKAEIERIIGNFIV